MCIEFALNELSEITTGLNLASIPMKMSTLRTSYPLMLNLVKVYEHSRKQIETKILLGSDVKSDSLETISSDQWS